MMETDFLDDTGHQIPVQFDKKFPLHPARVLGKISRVIKR